MARTRSGGKPVGFENEDFKMPTQSGRSTSEQVEDHPSHPGVKTAKGAKGAMQDGFTLPRGTGPKEAPDIGSPNVRRATKKNSIDINQQ